MKFLFSVLLVVGSVGASAVELSAASNRQILQELARRLDTGGGGGEAPTLVTYLCDNSGYLKAESLTPAGTTKSESKYLSSTQMCEEQATLLRRNKSKVYTQMMYALCDNSGYLYKNTVNEKGEFKNISSTYLSSYQACLPQATAINSQP